jgi:hypothetical protein
VAKWRVDRGQAVPEQLARYVPSEWLGPDPLGQWKEACYAWLEANPGRRLPFGEYGHKLDVLREVRRVKRGR